jgi:hypothetical protein
MTQKNPIPFSSASAQTDLRGLDTKIIVKLSNDVLIAGSPSEDFLSYGHLLGFIPREYKKPSISPIITARAFIMVDIGTQFIRYLSSIGTAKAYSVPMIWIHKNIIPGRFMLSFDACFVGEYNVLDIWRKLCRIIV